MKPEFSYSTTYVLNKSHFRETFEESVSVDDANHLYTKSVALAVVGLVVIYFTDISAYLGWFFVALGAVDALSVRYKKPWWLARQMLSRAANTELTLCIDEQGISSQSIHVDSKLPWSDIDKIEPTRQGWLLHQRAGKTYLSNRCLSDDAKAFLTAKAASKVA